MRSRALPSVGAVLSSISIREGRPDDAGALTAIARAAKAQWGYDSEWLQAWETDLTFTPEVMKSLSIVVAEYSSSSGSRLAGVAALKDNAGDLELEHLWVAPECGRRGVGRALFIAVARAASGTGRPIDIVSDPNAVGFYQRMGAQLVGAVPAPMPGAPDRTLPHLRYVCPSDL